MRRKKCYKWKYLTKIFVLRLRIEIPSRKSGKKSILNNLTNHVQCKFLNGPIFCFLRLTNFSTINPILYNVMSHRYRIAFRETLCSRKRGFYSSSNGFVRDQSSFRETTIAATGRDHNLNYEGSQLVS